MKSALRHIFIYMAKTKDSPVNHTVEPRADEQYGVGQFLSNMKGSDGCLLRLF